MSFDEDEWLGGTVTLSGVDYTLPAGLQRILKKAYEEEVWTVDDVPEDGTSLGQTELKAALALFNGAIADGARLLKLIALDTHKIRFERWFTAQYAQAVDDALDEETTKDLVMTDEFRADLELQKMKGASDLFGFELCMHLGRAVAPSEVKKAAYGKPPSSMQGAIDHGKVNKYSGGGARTLVELLEAARKSRDISQVETFFSETSYRMLDSTLMPYNQVGANRLQTFVLKAAQNIRDPLEWVIYHQEIRRKYCGRGLPLKDLFDTEVALSAAAQVRAIKEREAGGFIPPQGQFGKPRSALSESGSSVGPSASMVGSEMLSDVLTSLDGFSDKMGAIVSRLERLEAKDGGAPPPRKCWFCNSTEHLAEACQSPKALAARAAKAKRDEAKKATAPE